jgi:hypothetical protein
LTYDAFDGVPRQIQGSKNEFSHRLSLQATRDGGFRRRRGYGGQASSAIADYDISPACLIYFVTIVGVL